jgi:broad specificity phosphatase PhoE
MRTTILAAGAFLVIGAVLAGPFVTAAAAQEAVYVVRHAERVDDEKLSLLSAEGHARAARLAGILRDAGITRIFVTEYERTAQTAAPLAERLGLTPAVVPTGEMGALLEKLRAAGPKARVLVAGHSDTVPALLKALGCAEPITIAKAEYDNLFVVVAGGTSGPACLRLRY